MTSRLLFFALLLISYLQCCNSMATGLPKANGRPRPVIASSELPVADSNVNEIDGSQPFLSTAKNKNKNHGWAPKSKSSGTQSAVSMLFALTVLLSAPLPSNAGFGSGGAAVISFPETKALSIEDFMTLSPSKQRQREFSVTCLTKGSCETGANRLYEEMKLFNAKPREEEKLQDQLAELEERVLTAERESASSQLENSLKLQTEMFDKLGQQPAWVSYLAAAVGSTVSTLIMHPVDTIKVQLMNNNKNSDDESDDEDTDDEIDNSLSLSDAYKGIFANVFKEAPSSALYLGIYEIARTYLSHTALQGEPLLIYLLAGSIGEFAASWFRAPAEAVKTRLQLGSSGEDGLELTPLTAAKQVFFSQSGRDNLSNSWAASLLRDIPMGATQLAIFESAKTYVISSATINLDVGTISSEALFGCIGGGIAAFITTPADVITTISINSLSDTNLAQYRDKTPMEILQMLNAEGGMEAVFTGWKERTLYWTPAIGIFLSIYCSSRQFALSVL
jgi:solute carrier family 25 S-adenosylmethionine transporter 26